jgi:septal ring factor EnvC (AmiA/AmiB activator)
MAERRLIVFLGPEGRRGTLITHGFHDPRELDAARSQVRVEEAGAPAAAGNARGATAEQFAELHDELKRTRDEVASLQTRLQQAEEGLQLVRQELQSLKNSLGA